VVHVHGRDGIANDDSVTNVKLVFLVSFSFFLMLKLHSDCSVRCIWSAFDLIVGCFQCRPLGPMIITGTLDRRAASMIRFMLSTVSLHESGRQRYREYSIQITAYFEFCTFAASAALSSSKCRGCKFFTLYPRLTSWSAAAGWSVMHSANCAGAGFSLGRETKACGSLSLPQCCRLSLAAEASEPVGVGAAF
jgi:hypothetical protein